MEKLYKKLIKKKKKGFTLIELLAIIVILAIVMIVTIPTILGSVNNVRETTFINSVNILENWIEKQNDLTKLGQGANDAYVKLYSLAEKKYDEILMVTKTTNPSGFPSVTDKIDSLNAFLKAAGLDSEHYFGIRITYFSEKDNFCVELLNNTEGQFENLKANSEKNIISQTINGQTYMMVRSNNCQ